MIKIITYKNGNYFWNFENKIHMAKLVLNQYHYLF